MCMYQLRIMGNLRYSVVTRLLYQAENYLTTLETGGQTDKQDGGGCESDRHIK